MRDQFGVAVEVDDIVISAATREGGAVRFGKVYGFDRNGNPKIKAAGRKWIDHSYKPAWIKSTAGSHVIVVRKADATAPPINFLNELRRDYDLEVPE